MSKPLKITFRSKPVTVRKQYVYINGRKMGLNSLLKVLYAIDNRDAAFASSCSGPDEFAQFLHDTGIISSFGHRRCGMAADKGSKFGEVYQKLQDRQNRV
jgi:hypothetical protein